MFQVVDAADEEGHKIVLCVCVCVWGGGGGGGSIVCQQFIGERSLEEGILSFILHPSPSHPHIFTSIYVCSSDCSLSSLIPLSSSSTFGETRRKAAQPAGYFPAGETQYVSYNTFKQEDVFSHGDV